MAIYITTFNFEHVNNIITSQTYSTGITVTAKKEWGYWWGWRLIQWGVRYGRRRQQCWSRRRYNWIIIVEGIVKYVSEMSSTLPRNENEVICRFSFGMLFSHVPDLAHGRNTRASGAVTETFNCSCLSAYLGDESYSFVYKKGNVRPDNKLHALHS